MSDVIVQPTNSNSNYLVSQPSKPNYLIVLKAEEYCIGGELFSDDNKFFITMDKPDIGSQLVATKGFFVKLKLSSLNETLDTIYGSYLKLVSENNKNISEFMFPINRILFIKNLVFKAK